MAPRRVFLACRASRRPLAWRALFIAAALLLPLAGAQDAAEPTDLTIELRAGATPTYDGPRGLAVLTEEVPGERYGGT